MLIETHGLTPGNRRLYMGWDFESKGLLSRTSSWYVDNSTRVPGTWAWFFAAGRPDLLSRKYCHCRIIAALNDTAGPALSAANTTQNNIAHAIAADMEAVNAVIRQRLHSEVSLVNQIAEYIISAGGKRIRPVLVLLTANAYGYKGTAHHELAAVVEFIHTATLLHDDVVDESSMRRGRQTANALFGNAASVLVGDFLYSRSFQMMVSLDNMRVMRILSDATNVISEGEVLQLLNMHDPDVSHEAYLKVIRSKTAKLFEAAAELGALVAGATDAQIAAAGEYGRSLGTAFQLIDDVLDYAGDASEIGKNVGDDLREGKPTLPLIYLMEHGTTEQRELVRNCIETGDESQFDAVLSAITQSGALDYTRREAEVAAQRAADAIADLPDSVYKQSMLRLCTFAVDRNH
jgi:octaprenyl-diphosphate synthase